MPDTTVPDTIEARIAALLADGRLSPDELSLYGTPALVAEVRAYGTRPEGTQTDPDDLERDDPDDGCFVRAYYSDGTAPETLDPHPGYDEPEWGSADTVYDGVSLIGAIEPAVWGGGTVISVSYLSDLPESDQRRNADAVAVAANRPQPVTDLPEL